MLLVLPTVLYISSPTGNFDQARRIEQRRSLAFGEGLGQRGRDLPRGSSEGGMKRLFRPFRDQGENEDRYDERRRDSRGSADPSVAQVPFDSFLGRSNVTLGIA